MYATSQRIWIEWESTARAVIFERPLAHAFDHIGRLRKEHIGRLRKEFVPTAICIDLRKQPSANRFLLFFRHRFRDGVGLIEKVTHGVILILDRRRYRYAEQLLHHLLRLLQSAL